MRSNALLGSGTTTSCIAVRPYATYAIMAITPSIPGDIVPFRDR